MHTCCTGGIVKKFQSFNSTMAVANLGMLFMAGLALVSLVSCSDPMAR
jgi:Ca2+/H+ antiporter